MYSLLLLLMSTCLAVPDIAGHGFLYIKNLAGVPIRVTLQPHLEWGAIDIVTNGTHKRDPDRLHGQTMIRPGKNKYLRFLLPKTADGLPNTLQVATVKDVHGTVLLLEETVYSSTHYNFISFKHETETYYALESAAGPPTTTTSIVAPKEKGILLLSTRKDQNVPMVLNINGNYDYNIEFTYGDDTSAYRSCGATLNGEFWIFGGKESQKRQWSKINGCRLERVGTLRFGFYRGACNTYNFGWKEKVLLCFDIYSDQACHRFDGKRFEEASSSSYPHRRTYALAKYRGQPMTTGSYDPFNVKSEIMDLSTGKWRMAPDFPYAREHYSHYATAHTANAAYFIGGWADGYHSSRISQFKNDVWSELGNMKVARDGMSAITLGAETIIIGGQTGYSSAPPAKTEVWELENGSSKTIGPTLPQDHYAYGYALFIVDIDFCRK